MTRDVHSIFQRLRRAPKSKPSFLTQINSKSAVIRDESIPQRSVNGWSNGTVVAAIQTAQTGNETSLVRFRPRDRTTCVIND